ncbi:Integrase core domain protein [Mycobacterium marinum]|nr:Integrase core domain protein [Mycobacterium marinum]
MLHSDRGSQFRSRELQQSLFRHRMLGSMGQVGSAGDNAAMESFFSLLQKNVLNRRTWDTREQLRRSSPGSNAPTIVVAVRQHSAD